MKNGESRGVNLRFLLEREKPEEGQCDVMVESEMTISPYKWSKCDVMDVNAPY